MELVRIEIKNFRSIKDAKISFDHNCLILLGKNEAGKSNVLKAVAAVFGKYRLSNKDKRKKIDNEKIDEYYVRSVFLLNEDDFGEIISRFKSKFLNTDQIVFQNGETLERYLNVFFGEVIYRINIQDGAEVNFSYWNRVDEGFETTSEICCNGNALTLDNTGSKFDLRNEFFIIIKEYCQDISFPCHYWQYSDSYLLPNSVSISNFISNPSSCASLENIFALCDRENIQQEFEDSIAQDGDYSNLLGQVSKKVTSTFQKIWKDFSDTAIQLEPNGSEILIKVVNKTKYSFEDRSEGFKKFISILLMLSTQSRTKKIGINDIILIDEPDQSLYPTSARFLRDELLGIGMNSKIIYTTHSQYMIDTNNIDRHLIVEKNDDITIVMSEDKNAEYSNDELLRRAIGSSIFEILQSKNIIFEGWLDKSLFDKHCAFSRIEKKFSSFGKVYLQGISGVETLVQLLILANKKFLIVADSDDASNSRRKEFVTNYPEYASSWLSYSDVDEEVSTMEDFLTIEYVTDQIISLGYSDFKFDETKNVIQNIDIAVKKNKEEKQQIKNKLMISLTKNSIKAGYSEFVEEIKRKLESL
jgi:predicted ATP-dependent endonuclease of OLD family